MELPPCPAAGRQLWLGAGTCRHPLQRALWGRPGPHSAPPPHPHLQEGEIQHVEPWLAADGLVCGQTARLLGCVVPLGCGHHDVIDQHNLCGQARAGGRLGGGRAGVGPGGLWCWCQVAQPPPPGGSAARLHGCGAAATHAAQRAEHHSVLAAARGRARRRWPHKAARHSHLHRPPPTVHVGVHECIEEGLAGADERGVESSAARQAGTEGAHPKQPPQAASPAAAGRHQPGGRAACLAPATRWVRPQLRPSHVARASSPAPRSQTHTRRQRWGRAAPTQAAEYCMDAAHPG
jgi:hypothetical protein